MPLLSIAAGALTIAALVVRWRARSDDGLLFDDAWVAVGASRGALSDLLAVSTLHPGFSGLLMLWSSLGPTSTTWLSLPALLAGAALPVAVLWAARRLDVRPVVAVVVAFLALVAPTHVVYSGRVKPYTLETLAILVLAVTLGRISRRRWSADDAALWVVAAVAVGSVNAFALVATGVAAAVLVLHPCGDRSVRLVAAAAQAVLQGALLLVMRRSFDYEILEAGWGDTFDGYVELSANPLDAVREVATHLSRVGQVVVVDHRWLALGLVLLAGAGLVAEAWRGRHAVVARYLLALPLVALVGSTLELLPFGTIDQTSIFPGTRASLWLLPSVLVGAALAGERVAQLAQRRGPGARQGLALATASLLAVVVVDAVRFDVSYPAPGTETVVAAIDGRGDEDLVLLMLFGVWPVAAVEGTPFEVVPNRDSGVGFDPVLQDDRIEIVNPVPAWDGSPGDLRVTGGAAPGVPWRCIYVVEGAVGVFDANLDEMHAGLARAGFEQVDLVTAGQSSVEVWQHAGSPPC